MEDITDDQYDRLIKLLCDKIEIEKDLDIKKKLQSQLKKTVNDKITAAFNKIS